MTRVSGDWLDGPGAQAVLKLLEYAGHQAFLVGGAVRNALLGAPVTDLDIATDARPDRVTALAQAAGLRTVPTGIAHGTVTVIADDTPLEVTTFRRDVETDGRRAVVAFADTLREDAMRRDFTMNALYARADGTVVDPLGGLPDLRAGRVRFIGDAEARIREDYLRILRYFRFHAWYGDADGGLDAEALAACAALADGLEILPAERVTAEMLKLLAAPDPAPSVGGMAQAGILARVLAGGDPASLGVLVHLEGVAGVPPEPIRRLAALGGEATRLRLSRAQGRLLKTLRVHARSEAGTAELAWRLGPDAARDIELLRATAYGAPLPADLNARIDKGATARFPLTGRDLPDLRGPEISAELARLQDLWIASGFALSRDALLAAHAS
ncbi:polyA polymerase family protein [Oceaniovalibus guishaninsula JLT2003]|uniref:PolyA polymerase family protein n=1 Tax=Oceaniovalibus guishaninsula JLT2003 TaxID=1231392 RepID=K2HB24_9RHOB|nr:CCA tRNA nucleotidyltransferase [Oceaniovalibus guishaninsula]EKE44653.1 polyA polymerase family protein [Oceaniovalibus guishaninsula JLT2003]